jgi:hypothetical protein
LEFYYPKNQTHRKKPKKKPNLAVGLLYIVGLSAVGLLSFSQTISLSLLNDKKKEEEEWERSAGREKWERRRNKKKFSVLGCRIVL